MTAPVMFHLRLSPEPDALARALGVLLLSQAEILSVSYVSGLDCSWSLMHLDGLTSTRTDALKRRLQALPCVFDLQPRSRSTCFQSPSGSER